MSREEVKVLAVKWYKIRAEYVTGNISLRKLAQKHNISVSQLSKRASKEAWAKQREENRYKMSTKAVQKALDRNAEKMAAQLMDIGTAAENLAALIARVSTETQTLNVGRTRRTDTKAVRNLTGALKDLTGVLRDVYELPTLKEKQQLDRETGTTAVDIVFDEDEEHSDHEQSNDPPAAAEPETE